MAAIEWSDDLLTGNETIDGEHRSLFHHINNLLAACAEGRGRDEVGRTLDFLEQYTRDHFAHEQRVMTEHGFSGMEAHLAEHTAFLDQVAKLRQEFDANGPGPYLVVLTNKLVSGWLTGHIRKTDTELALFLRSRD